MHRAGSGGNTTGNALKTVKCPHRCFVATKHRPTQQRRSADHTQPVAPTPVQTPDLLTILRCPETALFAGVSTQAKTFGLPPPFAPDPHVFMSLAGFTPRPMRRISAQVGRDRTALGLFLVDTETYGHGGKGGGSTKKLAQQLQLVYVACRWLVGVARGCRWLPTWATCWVALSG